MSHTDSRFWWKDLPEAKEAYCRVCAVGWRGIQGTVIPQLFDRAEPEGLFLMYFALQIAIESYVSTVAFQNKYMGSMAKLKGSKGGPQ